MFRNQPSQAKEFFNRVKQEGNTFLESLVNSTPPTFETDWLDFKGAEKLEIKSNDIKKIWSKALSGFANTGGGVLVWGIDARKDKETQIDCAGALSLVDSPLTLQSRLIELHSQSTNPPVSDVEYWASSKENGFLVCYIPESPFKPVRSEANGNQYFIRAGDSFQVPSVSLLRSLFHPEYQAFLEMELFVYHDREQVRNVVRGLIHNIGSATAKNCMVTVETNIPSRYLSAEEGINWASMAHPINNNRLASRAILSRIPLHPGTQDYCFELFITPDFLFFAEEKTIKFKIKMYSENNNPLFTEIAVSPDDFEDKKEIRGKSEILGC